MPIIHGENLRSVLESSTAPCSSSGSSMTAVLVADIKCLLGECVVYDDRTDSIKFTDIYQKQFHELCLTPSPLGYGMTSFDLPKQLCAFGLLSSETHDENCYLCAWEDGFQLYNIKTNSPLSDMSSGENVIPLGAPTRLNDGRCDRSGRRFICGGFYGDVKGNTMKVFQCMLSEKNKTSLQHCELISVDAADLEVTNSICFSPDGSTMYFADSPKRKIFEYNYVEESGRCSNKRVLYQASVGVPDGSCVDKEGFIWNAAWRSGYGTGRVNRIDPSSGKIVFTVLLPDATSQASCCCLGGKNFDILFISTASVDRDIDKEPNAGGLYAVKVPFIGLKESRFSC